MASVRRTLPVILTVGAGFVGYQYVYRPNRRETLEIYDGITVYQPWRVWFMFTHSLLIWYLLLQNRVD